MSQITRDLDLCPVWRQLELFEGRCSLFCKSIFGLPEAEHPKKKGTLKSQPPLAPRLSFFPLKAWWPPGAQHQCFAPGTSCVPCHLLQQPVPLKYITF